MDDISKTIDKYNLNKKRKILIDMLNNKKLNKIVTELFIRGGKKYFSCFYHTVLFRCYKKY